MPLQCDIWGTFGACLLEDLLSHTITVRYKGVPCAPTFSDWRGSSAENVSIIFAISFVLVWQGHAYLFSGNVRPVAHALLIISCFGCGLEILTLGT